jgi:nucleoside-diphosphate-sugar epimerase
VRTKVLVTGGSGFIGGHVVELLEERGCDVLILDVQYPYEYRPGPSTTFALCDVAEPLAAENHVKGFGGVDAIIHLAGVLGTSSTIGKEHEAIRGNISTTLEALKIARRYDAKFVTPLVANTWRNPYSITKNAAAAFVEQYRDEYGLATTLVREAHVYGPRQKVNETQKLVPTLISCALKGLPLPVFEDGQQPVCPVYVRDAAEGLVRLALSREALLGEQVAFATGPEVSVNDVARLVLELTGSGSEIQRLGRRPGQSGRDDPYGDTDALFRAVGRWETVELTEGLRRTVDWYAGVRA